MSSRQESDKVRRKSTPVRKIALSKIIEASVPSDKRVPVIVAGLYLIVLLVALDRFTIAIAVPNITDDFNCLAEVGWQTSAYFLTVYVLGLSDHIIDIGSICLSSPSLQFITMCTRLSNHGSPDCDPPSSLSPFFLNRRPQITSAHFCFPSSQPEPHPTYARHLLQHFCFHSQDRLTVKGLAGPII